MRRKIKINEPQMIKFIKIICKALETSNIEAVPNNKYIAIRIPDLGTTYLKIERHVQSA